MSGQYFFRACTEPVFMFERSKVRIRMRNVTDSDLVMLQWHLVLCKPNQYHIAQRALTRLDCEIFLPLQHAQRRWRGRILRDLRPVFPGYVFVGMDPARPIWQSIRTASGVSRIIGFGEQGPAVVPSEIVAGLMSRCDMNGVLQPLREGFEVGDKIKIVSGAFADFITEIDRIDPEHRLHVLLELLGRPTKVILDPKLAIRSDA
jgi:transcriptional antiterminator RfaH